MAIKTKKNWEKTDIDLDHWLKPMDEIDYDLYAYSWAWVPTYWDTHGFIQWGEAQKHEGDVCFRMTYSEVGGKYFYLGILPEFKQPD